jgi:imidazolonepropionase-like amidohydrolase
MACPIRMKDLFLGSLAAGLLLSGGTLHGQAVGVKGGGPRVASHDLAIRNVEILTVSGARISHGTIILKGERIAAMGISVAVPSGAEVVDGSGLTACPGFFDAFSGLGLTEIANVPASNDSQETADPITPQLRASDSYFLDSELLPVVRAAGILAVLSAPGPGAVIAGQAALMRTAGGTVEEAGLQEVAGLLVNLGEPPKRAFGERGKAPQTRMGIAALLRQTLMQGREYAAKRAADAKVPVDARLEPVAGALAGRVRVLVRAHRRDDILTALRLADEFGLKLVLVGGSDAPRLAGELAKRAVPVILWIDQQPDTPETAGASYDAAAVLQRAGVRVAFGSNETTLSRQLVANVGLAVAYGLPYDEALKALTLSAAQIFGVDDRLGSLEVGKEATLFLSRGDPLQVTSRVVSVFVRGARYEPQSYQTALCEQYIAPKKGAISCLPK